MHKEPFVIIDGAHNLDAARVLANEIRRFPKDRLILVIGMVSGHSIEDVISTLAPLANIVIATKSSSLRAARVEEVASVARRYCSNVEQITPVPAAVRRALTFASEKDLICITGSFYTVGEVPRDIDSLLDKF